MTYDVLLLGATGNSGRLIAAELAARRMSILLAGRNPDRLAEVAGLLTADSAMVDVRSADVTDPASLRAVAADAAVVLTTVGPFARYSAPVVEACLAAGVGYVDIANELPAVRALLERDEEAKSCGVTLVTGAGFGPAATETLVLRLVSRLGGAPDRVRVAAAPAVVHESHGVRETVLATLPEGATTYVGGELVRAPLGSGMEILDFGGAKRRMLPGPVGDLEAARLASGAADVIAYIPEPGARDASDGNSYTWAEVVDAAGRRFTAELRLGEGVRASAAIAAETARRLLAGTPPGVWTPGRLFGADLVTDATNTDATNTGPPTGATNTAIERSPRRPS